MVQQFKIYSQQESPPAWTQEAYRPHRIKYSICYLRWGTPRQGYPRPSLMGGGGYPRWGTLPPPSRGTPGQVWWGVPEVGYPFAEVPHQGTTHWGTPARPNGGGGFPSCLPPGKGTPWLGIPPSGPGRGTPPTGVDRLKTLPSLILRMPSVITTALHCTTKPIQYLPRRVLW